MRAAVTVSAKSADAEPGTLRLSAGRSWKSRAGAGILREVPSRMGVIAGKSERNGLLRGGVAHNQRGIAVLKEGRRYCHVTVGKGEVLEVNGIVRPQSGYHFAERLHQSVIQRQRASRIRPEGDVFDDSAPNSRVAAPLIIALPEPVTAPLIVMFPPFAQISPEFAISLFTIRAAAAGRLERPGIGHDIRSGVDH